MALVQLPHDRCLVVGFHFQVIEVEPFVERLVEEPSGYVGADAVQRLRIGRQVESIAQYLCADGKFRTGVGQSGLRSVTLHLDVEQLGADLGFRHRPEPHEADQTVFLIAQFLEFPLKARVQLPRRGGLVGHNLFHPGSHLVNEVSGQLQRGVVIDDRVLHQLDWKVGEVADAFLPAATEKIPVADMTPALWLRVDQAEDSARLGICQAG
ncbi:hypothetical protein [Nocardia sp. alder85J]|uniref:hypothetical protein n=1 Tax=Nocardia sp. alder85J TaxID=2862949 RepID=UPI001CD6CEF3|nr:hypothetical protein [Nocardia sp. alder85J]MCX4097405.1 hypothetical protein [Nocardia sp. alder85J]